MSAASPFVALSLAAYLILASGCGETTVVGSTCQAGECPELPECRAAEQQYPLGCDKETRTCFSVPLPMDDQVCNDCYGMLDRLNVDSPLGPCACTYCGVQLTRCFASAETEPDGDTERDKLCQAIIQCGWHHGCVGSDCYCGTGVGRDECFKNANEGRPLGPCAKLIESAAVCSPDQTRFDCLVTSQLAFNTVLGRASEVAKCVSGDPALQGNEILEEGAVLEGEAVVPMCR